MAIPTQPTETTIAQKAYRLYGKSSPSTSDLTNLISDGIAMVKSDLMDEGREWSFLRRTAYLPCTISVNHVQAPTDYAKPISAVVLDGTRRNTAQAGTSTTITLASTDTGGEDDTESKQIVITGGTGSGQARQITDFNTSTKIATVDSSWDTNPDATSTYLVVDEQNVLNLKQIWNYAEIQQLHLEDEPQKLFHFADDAEGDFYLDYSPDKVYAIRVDYYADLRKEDTNASANPRYARILRMLEQVFVQGCFVWLLQDDTRSTIETQKYASMLARAAGQFLYPNDANQAAGLAEDVY